MITLASITLPPSLPQPRAVEVVRNGSNMLLSAVNGNSTVLPGLQQLNWWYYNYWYYYSNQLIFILRIAGTDL